MAITVLGTGPASGKTSFCTPFLRLVFAHDGELSLRLLTRAGHGERDVIKDQYKDDWWNEDEIRTFYHYDPVSAFEFHLTRVSKTSVINIHLFTDTDRHLVYWTLLPTRILGTSMIWRIIWKSWKKWRRSCGKTWRGKRQTLKKSPRSFRDTWSWPIIFYHSWTRLQ